MTFKSVKDGLTT